MASTDLDMGHRLHNPLCVGTIGEKFERRFYGGPVLYCVECDNVRLEGEGVVWTLIVISAEQVAPFLRIKKGSLCFGFCECRWESWDRGIRLSTFVVLVLISWAGVKSVNRLGTPACTSLQLGGDAIDAKRTQTCRLTGRAPSGGRTGRIREGILSFWSTPPTSTLRGSPSRCGSTVLDG